MHRAMLQIDVSEDQRSIALSALRSLRGPIRALTGCLGCAVCEDVGQIGRIRVQASWEDEAALQRYIRSRLFSELLSVVELAMCPPHFAFESVGERRGLEYASSVRRAGHCEEPCNACADATSS